MSSPARPYRSHKVPACETCKKRKIRCHLDVADEPCRFCRENDVPGCRHSDTNRRNIDNEDTVRSKRKIAGIASDRLEAAPERRSKAARSASSLPPSVDRASHEPTLLANPPMAEDLEILEQYLISNSLESGAAMKQYRKSAGSHSGPVIHLSLPRRRRVFETITKPGQKQREIMDQILGRSREYVIGLYFDYIHPCFPVVDQRTFLELWTRDKKSISPTLVCDIYAVSIVFWRQSKGLKDLPQPDMLFAWDQAVAALHDDFKAPTVSTIHAALLDMIGRPISRVQSNIMTIGRTVTLAHSLGLHRDPTNWKITDHEKGVRINLWWGVMVHDAWSSLAHGTPPTIQRHCYDVPLPQMSSDSQDIDDEKDGLRSFFYLCSLTEVLVDLLPLVYSLKVEATDANRRIKRLDCSLDDWESSVPSDLKKPATTMTVSNGSSSLWLCYLSLRLLVCRLSLRIESHSSSSSKLYRQSMLRDAAVHLTDYCCSLSADQLAEFWLPYTAYLLASATTILLRCIIETTDELARKTAVAGLKRFHGFLLSTKNVNNWDLGDFVLERCNDSIERIIGIFGEETSGPSEVQASTLDAQEVSASLSLEDYSDLLLPADGLDFPFGTIWEDFSGPFAMIF